MPEFYNAFCVHETAGQFARAQYHQKAIEASRYQPAGPGKSIRSPQSVISMISNGAIKDPSYDTLRKLLVAIDRLKDGKQGFETQELRTVQK